MTIETGLDMDHLTDDQVRAAVRSGMPRRRGSRSRSARPPAAPRSGGDLVLQRRPGHERVLQ